MSKDGSLETSNLDFTEFISDEEAVRQGVEYRRKANLLLQTKRGTSEDVFSCFSESILRFLVVLDDVKKRKEYDYILAIFEIALAYLDKANAIEQLGTPPNDTDTYHGLLEKVIKVIDMLPPDEITADAYRMQASAFYNLAKYKSEVNLDFAGAEKSLVISCEKLFTILRQPIPDESALQMLEIVSDELHNGKKQRQRNGKAVYHTCADFMIPSGLTRKFKNRFCVVDDSSLNYYADKKTWEAGPVSGSNKIKPKGVIMFSDILDISTHDKNCPVLKPSLRPTSLRNSVCVHIHASDTVYNMLSPAYSTVSEYSLFPQVLAEAVRSYKAKKEAKQFITKKGGKISAMSAFAFDSDDEEDDANSVYTGPKRSSIVLPGKSEKKEVKKKMNVTWNEEPQIMATETSKFPFYQNEEEYEEQEPEVEQQQQTVEKSEKKSKKKKKKKSSETNELTLDTFEDKLFYMSDESSIKLFNDLLDDFEKNGTMRKMFELMIRDEPKKQMLRLCTNDANILPKISTFLET